MHYDYKKKILRIITVYKNQKNVFQIIMLCKKNNWTSIGQYLKLISSNIKKYTKHVVWWTFYYWKSFFVSLPEVIINLCISQIGIVFKMTNTHIIYRHQCKCMSTGTSVRKLWSKLHGKYAETSTCDIDRASKVLLLSVKRCGSNLFHKLLQTNQATSHLVILFTSFKFCLGKDIKIETNYNYS